MNTEAIEVKSLSTNAEPRYVPCFSGAFSISLIITLSIPRRLIIVKNEIIEAP